LSLTDQAIAFGAGQLTEATVRQMLGSVDRSYVFRLLEALAQGDGKTVVETSETLRLNGLSAASTLEEMSAVLQRMAVLQAVPSAAAEADDTDPEAADLARLAALMPADETQLLYSICLHGRGELGLAPDEYAALTMVLLRLLAFKPQTGQRPVAEKKTLNNAVTEAPRAVAVPAPAARPVPVLPVPPPRPVSLPTAVAQTVPPATQSRVPPWEDEPNMAPASAEHAPVATKSEVNPERVPEPPPGQQLHVVTTPAAADQVRDYEQNKAIAPVQSAQDATKIVAIPVRVQADSRTEAVAGQTAAVVLVPTEEGEFWHLTVQQLIAGDAITALVRELALQSQLVARDTDQWLLRVERESLNQPGSRDRLTTALQAAGHGVRLVVEIGRVTDSPARRNAAAAAERQLAAEKIIFDDPFVQTMMRDFGAKIVPGSIKPG
jgi:DNA polymerase-3 subunit gamma/tau